MNDVYYSEQLVEKKYGLIRDTWKRMMSLATHSCKTAARCRLSSGRCFCFIPFTLSVNSQSRPTIFGLASQRKSSDTRYIHFSIVADLVVTVILKSIERCSNEYTVSLPWRDIRMGEENDSNDGFDTYLLGLRFYFIED
jgi:hypothetical protein